MAAPRPVKEDFCVTPPSVFWLSAPAALSFVSIACCSLMPETHDLVRNSCSIPWIKWVYRLPLRNSRLKRLCQT